MEPALEPVGVAQGPQFAPRGHVRHLDGVLGEVEVAQDAIGDREAAIARSPDQGVEGLVVTDLCELHERSKHLASLDRATS